jgi:hypothetical protein
MVLTIFRADDQNMMRALILQSRPARRAARS